MVVSPITGDVPSLLDTISDSAKASFIGGVESGEPVSSPLVTYFDRVIPASLFCVEATYDCSILSVTTSDSGASWSILGAVTTDNLSAPAVTYLDCVTTPSLLVIVST